MRIDRQKVLRLIAMHLAEIDDAVHGNLDNWLKYRNSAEIILESIEPYLREYYASTIEKMYEDDVAIAHDIVKTLRETRLY